MAVISVDNLGKEYGNVTALDGASFTIEEGEVFGFLGPNGAGKTTTINILLAFSSPSSGSVEVFGMDPADNEVTIRQRTGSLLEGYGVYPTLTGREHLSHARDVKGTDSDIPSLLERIDIIDDADRPAGTYSKGMKQRMALGMAVLGDPDLLVLDEPTTGMDPNGARMVREMVRDRSADGTTVFFSSHILEQVEAVADRVGIIHDGTIIAEGDLEKLRTEFGFDDKLTVTVETIPSQLVTELERIPGVSSVTEHDSQVDIIANSGDAKLECLETIDGHDVLIDFQSVSSSLDEVFSEVTGASR